LTDEGIGACPPALFEKGSPTDPREYEHQGDNTDAQQPDFLAMAANMNDASRAHASMAIHLERTQNIPAFNAGEDILKAIRALSRLVDDRFDAINIVLIRCKFNRYLFCSADVHLILVIYLVQLPIR
jgi:hypothetical protein